MPNLKAAKKDLRQSEARQVRNQTHRSEVSFLTRMLRKSVDKNDTKAAQDFASKAIKQIDKGTKKNIYKANTAGRKKSIIMKKLNSILNKSK